MWIRTNSVLIVLSVCWTLLCFYSGTMPFLSISLLIIVRVSIHCFINGSSCNNVAISHFSCGLYVNFTVHKFYMSNVRMTRFVYFELSGLTRQHGATCILIFHIYLLLYPGDKVLMSCYSFQPVVNSDENNNSACIKIKRRFLVFDNGS